MAYFSTVKWPWSRFWSIWEELQSVAFSTKRKGLWRWWWYLVAGESMECCEHEQQPGPVSVCRCVCVSIMFTDGQIVTSFGHIWHYSDAVQCLDYLGSWLLETVCCYQLIIVTWWGAIITKSTLATLLCSVWPRYSIFIFQHVTAINCAKNNRK